MKKTIANRTFEKVAENYSFNISKRHLILIVPDGDEWEAREVRVPKSGSYMEGTKEVKIENRVHGKTLEEAGQKIFEIIESDEKYVIRDREAGNEITHFDTMEEAQAELERFEENDKTEGTYEEDFYEIVKKVPMKLSVKKAQETYDKKCKIVTIRLNRDTESDLVEWFEKNPGTASTKIKQMIRDLIG